MIIPEAIAFDYAATPVVIVELTVSCGVTQARVESFDLGLYGIRVVFCQRIEDVGTTEPDSSRCA